MIFKILFRIFFRIAMKNFSPYSLIILLLLAFSVECYTQGNNHHHQPPTVIQLIDLILEDVIPRIR